MNKMILSTGNIILSLVLGAIVFGFVFIKYPTTMDQILNVAAGFKTWLTTRGIDPVYNNWLRVLLEERQLVFMFFTIITRIVLSLIVWIATSLLNSVRNH